MKTLPPYAQLLQLRTEEQDGALRFVMPFHDDVVGRPGFLHGGAIAGLLEFAAFTALSRAIGEEAVTMKPITVTVDYMRGGTPADTYAEARDRTARQAHRQCRGLRLAGGARQADRLGADQFPARPALVAAELRDARSRDSAGDPNSSDSTASRFM